MRKIVLLIAICVAFLPATQAAVIPTSNPDPLVNIGHGVSIPLSKALTLTNKEYRKLTGHRMGIVKSIAFKVAKKKAAKVGDNQITAAIICGLVGTLGIHRFYLGYTWQGIVQLLTFGGLGIWTLIDFVRILTGKLTPKDSEYDKTF